MAIQRRDASFSKLILLFLNKIHVLSLGTEENLRVRTTAAVKRAFNVSNFVTHLQDKDLSFLARSRLSPS